MAKRLIPIVFLAFLFTSPMIGLKWPYLIGFLAGQIYAVLVLLWMEHTDRQDAGRGSAA